MKRTESKSNELIPQRLVPVLARSKPDFHEVGNRVLEANKKYQQIDVLLDQLADEWVGHPYVRSKKVTPDILDTIFQKIR